MRKLTLYPLVLLMLLSGFWLAFLNKEPVKVVDNFNTRAPGLVNCLDSPTVLTCLNHELALNGQVNGFNSSAHVLFALEQDPIVSPYCHNFAHQLGYKAFDYYQNLDFVNSNTSPGCQGGFIHGLFERAAQKGYTIKDVDFCLQLSISADCEHAYGHYLYNIYHKLTLKAIEKCSIISKRESCVDGLFMANSVNNQSKDLSIFKLCKTLPNWSRDKCYVNSFYGIGDTYIITEQKPTLQELCFQLGKEYVTSCFQGLGYGSRSLLDNTALSKPYLNLCSHLGKIYSGCVDYVILQNTGFRNERFYQDLCLAINFTSGLCERYQLKNKQKL